MKYIRLPRPVSTLATGSHQLAFIVYKHHSRISTERLVGFWPLPVKLRSKKDHAMSGPWIRPCRPSRSRLGRHALGPLRRRASGLVAVSAVDPYPLHCRCTLELLNCGAGELLPARSGCLTHPPRADSLTFKNRSESWCAGLGQECSWRKDVPKGGLRQLLET